ncbi:hypothetical protein [Oceanithermus sp.]|uniref:hypothetical protein n=1 Tax=Oceanithermus sp. TaxID=2268145 RepID=UPI0025ECC21F|nr:hypothetical protein [Oceanithermus sp.]
MPETTTQYVPEVTAQYGYEWMNALSQAGDLFGDLFPVFEAYGLVPGQDATEPAQPQPTIVVQPVPEPERKAITLDQIPSWAWGIAGLLIAALIFRR